MQQPIGIFDSGVGGLTVAHAISKHLPHESIYYFGDIAHLPYGDKSPEVIQRYSVEIAIYLEKLGCKLLVIACNTASAIALDAIYAAVKIPVVNVIEPTANYICTRADWKKIGVIGTKATIRSNVYERVILKQSPSLEVASLATPLLVPMIEEGLDHSLISEQVLNSYLSYPDFLMIDCLILGCTHYPILQEEIQQYFKGRVECVDATQTTPLAVEKALLEQSLLCVSGEPQHRFFVSDITKPFEQAAKRFYGNQIQLEKVSL